MRPSILAFVPLALAVVACAPSTAGPAPAADPDLGSLEQAATAATGPVSVQVVNTSAAPVPVTGAVAVTGTASVSVSNTPSVTVANVPSVDVANAVSLAADSVVTARQGGAPWSVSLADNTVALAPGATVTAQIAGTPAVTVGNTVLVSGKVAVTNLPATQNVALAADASGLTHVRRPASDLVYVVLNKDTPVTRLLPDGTQVYEWTPPAGKVLVITDASYETSDIDHPDRLVRVDVAPGGVFPLRTTFELDGHGEGGTAVRLQAGLVVRAGATITCRMYVDLAQIAGNCALLGYLVDDR